MPRTLYFALIFLCLNILNAQDEVRLPADLRQHNLTTYNSSLFNPVFSLDRNDPESVAFWTRWQWQSIDADPTTLYLNYTRPFKENSVLGAAFFQHNTGIFFNTGGVVNYAHQIQFSRSVKLAFGFNLFGFVQELADTRFQPDPNLPIPEATSDFILQWAPGAAISVERLTLSMASENLLDYNFRAKEANTPAADKIFMGMMSYDFPINLGAQKALLRPSLYLRTIPQQENQIGILSLLRTSKYWAQLGYNNFYGVGIGGGGTFLRKFNLGAVFEFGTSASINSKDPSFEIVASYFLGNPDERDVAAVYEDGMEEEVVLEEELAEEEKIKEELEKAEELANEEKPKEDDPDRPEVEEEEAPKEEMKPLEEVDEPTEEEPVIEEISKKEQRQVEKEAAAEEKRLKKEQDRIAKEEKDRLEDEAKEKARLAKIEQEQLEREMKEAKAKEEEEAKQAELAEKQKEELQKAEAEKAEQERIAAEKAEAEKSVLQKRQDSIAAVQKAAQEAAQQAATKKRLDSIAEARKAQAEADAQAKEAQRKLDSIAQAEAAITEVEQEEVEPEAGEKYEEVQTEDGLEPGFYLIANVFGTQKYFEAFMADLNNRGLAPKSFLRSLNNYNYVYLERYDTMAEARRARDSKFNSRYNDKTWVFRVVGN